MRYPEINALRKQKHQQLPANTYFTMSTKCINHVDCELQIEYQNELNILKSPELNDYRVTD